MDVISVKTIPRSDISVTDATKTKTSAEGPGGPTLAKEWETARDIIAKGDERTDALRRYGFTFVTSLVTADALLLRRVGDSTLPWVSFGVALVASMLVVGMRLLEKTTELLQRAAAQRATVIERQLALELTDIIRDRYARQDCPPYVDYLYFFFVVCVGVAGYAIGGWSDYPDPSFWIRSALAGSVVPLAYFAIRRISKSSLHHPRGEADDWSLDRVKCNRGEPVRLPYTRFESIEWPFRTGDVVWRAKLHGSGVAFDYVADEDDDDALAGDDGPTKIWLWDTTDVPRGFYDIIIDPKGRGKRPFVLDRRVRVR